jgi:DnaJ-class molecular chaperone
MFTLKCRPCRGRGYYGDDPTDTCTVCEGRGHVFVDADRADYKDCRACRASGFERGDPHKTCAKCHGWGIVER